MSRCLQSFAGIEEPRRFLVGGSVGLHVDVFATLLACGEHYNTVDKSEDSVVLAHSDIEAGMVLCATLTLDDVACLAL